MNTTAFKLIAQDLGLSQDEIAKSISRLHKGKSRFYFFKKNPLQYQKSSFSKIFLLLFQNTASNSFLEYSFQGPLIVQNI
jgi:hypothetical protein